MNEHKRHGENLVQLLAMNSKLASLVKSLLKPHRVIVSTLFDTIITFLPLYLRVNCFYVVD